MLFWRWQMSLKWKWVRVIAKTYFPYMLWCLEDREQWQIHTVDWTNTSEGLTHYLTCLMTHGSPHTHPQHSSRSRSKGVKAFGVEQKALWRYFNLHLLLPWRNWGSLSQLVGENQGKVLSCNFFQLQETRTEPNSWATLLVGSQGNLRKTVLGNLTYATNTHLIQSVFISALQLYFKECFCWMMCYWLVDR